MMVSECKTTTCWREKLSRACEGFLKDPTDISEARVCSMLTEYQQFYFGQPEQVDDEHEQAMNYR